MIIETPRRQHCWSGTVRACPALAFVLIWVLALCCALNIPPAFAAEKKKSRVFTITYLLFEDDEHYAPRRSYTGLELVEPSRPLNGARLALKESRVIGRSLGLRFELVELAVSQQANYLENLSESLEATGSFAVIADVPRGELIRISTHFRHDDILLFNARLPDDELRSAHCAEKLFHTIPSHAMLTDTLAQFLKAKNWTSVLSLQGPQAADLLLASAMEKSAAKFGLNLVGKKDFILSNNPRDRNKTNVPTLTSRPKHDVVFIADEYGEFARYVPYQTYASRLVVGSEGLVPAAWHRTWERHGAPQLNQRFDKLAGAQMSSEEWAGWAAVKSLVSALAQTATESRAQAPVQGNTKTEDQADGQSRARRASRKAKTDFVSVFGALSSEQLTIDLYKGAPGNYRPWNNQLRQPLLLHTHSAVIERAPLDGFMHHRNTLDTLGSDEAESGCRW